MTNNQRLNRGNAPIIRDWRYSANISYTFRRDIFNIIRTKELYRARELVIHATIPPGETEPRALMSRSHETRFFEDNKAFRVDLSGLSTRPALTSWNPSQLWGCQTTKP
ncbi:hypothetical protein J1614_007756 [Plenodomus biglobosus]|nr:hypothetical protein J1614_007756 [Plenodomus biglobosus]